MEFDKKQNQQSINASDKERRGVVYSDAEISNSSTKAKKSDLYHSDMHLELRVSDIGESELVNSELKEIDDAKTHHHVIGRFNQLRTKQLLVLMFATIFVGLVNNVINLQSEPTTYALIASAIVLAVCYRLVLYGRVVLGGMLMLWTLYATLTVLLVVNDGLRDPVTIGYTGILIFAAMLGHKKQFIILTSTMGLSFILVALANQEGWLDYSAIPFNWGVTIDLFIIYSVISYAAWTLASDLRFAMSRLHVENQKVNESKKEYQRIAQYDQLTGLPNRIIAVDRFNQAIFHSHRNNAKVAVLFLDLDNFKTVNDSLGHAVGDKLLQKISERLISSVREGDTVCRLGGDEFLILLEGILEDTAITRISNKILTNISEPIEIEEHVLTATCSVGIAISPTDGSEFDDLRKKADMAMYRAKNSGRNAFMFFDDAMNKDMLAHIDRVNSLRNAITNKEFILHYQPKLDLSSNKIFSAEALIRWQSPNGNLVKPDEFIPIAENTGLIIEIGEWVLYEACRQCKEFQQRGLVDFSVAVNLSSIQFRRGNLEAIVNGALASSGLNASYLELEITESLLVEDTRNIKQQIQALQKLGVTFSIDDFGTGYSSLSYLRDFNFDFLKIDRTFIENSLEKESDMVLCEAIIGMAHKLKLMVVAEGIESEQQRDALFSAGCEFGQGNYFSHAVPVEQFYRLEGLRMALTDDTENKILNKNVV
jgi:diguanylate cyclase (GGDEF)-like protein